MLKPNCPPGELTYQQGYQQAKRGFRDRASVHPPGNLL
ncbi:hypothetical protein MC7420_6266 [Coleofasciculus chthonoplastes PCC 7420]|uniref:Uncharacterized protein n=1 Tax=Coleofasciculus chthonoplastes PCC 7420 TaxID=118168 RepID=B4VQA0_9CYAN|nr:hypothetical protein MC7420_6266 [Coleofasciculus chthonoplastes PCC 7420]